MDLQELRRELDRVVSPTQEAGDRSRLLGDEVLSGLEREINILFDSLNETKDRLRSLNRLKDGFVAQRKMGAWDKGKARALNALHHALRGLHKERTAIFARIDELKDRREARESQLLHGTE